MQSAETVWYVADNSGVATAKQIKVYRSKKLWGQIGDFVVVVPKKIKKQSNVLAKTGAVFELKKYGTLKKKYRKRYSMVTKKIYLGLVLSLRKWTKRKNGHYFHSSLNKVVLYNLPQRRSLFSRIYGPIPKEFHMRRLRYKFQKVISYASSSY